MKFNYSKFMFPALMLLVSFATFAQAPDPDDQAGTPDPPASINTKLIWLAVIGLAFAYYQFNLRAKKA